MSNSLLAETMTSKVTGESRLANYEWTHQVLSFDEWANKFLNKQPNYGRLTSSTPLSGSHGRRQSIEPPRSVSVEQDKRISAEKIYDRWMRMDCNQCAIADAWAGGLDV